MTLPVERFSARNPCPVCGGHQDLARGRGIRCSGYFDSSGDYARCSREQAAGELVHTKFENDDGTWSHLLKGDCRCGRSHGTPTAHVNGNGNGNGSTPNVAAGRKTIYVYTDEQGTPLSQVVRIDHEDGKSFSQQKLNKHGFALKTLGNARRVIYRLPHVVAAIEAGETIYVAEGEKDVHALEAAGVVATCNPMGAGSWRDEYSEFLRNARDVIIVADKDAQGYSHAAAVAESIRTFVGSVRVVEAAVGKDAHDHFAAGRTLEEFSDGAVLDISPEILDDICTYASRFVRMSRAQLDALALWAAHTYCFDAAETTLYVHVSSAEMRSGKTRVKEVFEPLVHQPRAFINPSAAALFHVIHECRPTLFIDEVDGLFNMNTISESYEAIRCVLNAGFRIGSTVPRVTGVGTKKTITEYNVFCPKMLIGIGELPGTIADRSVRIRLERQPRPEPYYRRYMRAEVESLRLRLELWAQSLHGLEDAYPKLPPDINDRLAEAWEPLFAIADAAGSEWAARARNAARELASEAEEAIDRPQPNMLLRDIREIFNRSGALTLRTKDIVTALWNCEERIWFDYQFGRPITSVDLARELKPYKIRSAQIKFNGIGAKGYRRADFEQVWRRYISATSEEEDE